MDGPAPDGETARKVAGERLMAASRVLLADVGMLSEEYDPVSEEQLGNTPQALSLVGLVNTARHLDGGPWHTAEDPRRCAPARWRTHRPGWAIGLRRRASGTCLGDRSQRLSPR